MKRLLLALIAIVIAAGVVWYLRNRPERPTVAFAPDASPPVDFARLEYTLPLSIDDRVSLTPRQFKSMTQEEVDQIYARLTAGPIPDGPYDGDLMFPRGVDGDTRLAEILGGRLKARLANIGVRKTEFLGRTLWKGKVFYRDTRLLRNRIEDLSILAPIMGGNTTGIEKINVGGRDAFLLFPAKLYCGQSLLDGRRESIIIDYAFTDELPGYREQPDSLGGREGLRIRDEIRMIRPGFYLGRAYLNRVFGLNFTLYNAQVADAGLGDFKAGKIAEDCWSGTQQAKR
jgi:hypothetical protein